MKIVIEIEANQITKKLIISDQEFTETQTYKEHDGIGRLIESSQSIEDQIKLSEFDIDGHLLELIESGDIDFIESHLSSLE